MTLGIHSQPQPTNALTGEPVDNPYALTKEEQEQWAAWEAMDDGDKGEYLHHAKQELTTRDTFDNQDYWNRINGDVCVQRIAGGGAVVGGAIRPDALVTIGGLEMTVQQAVDVGLRPASMIGHQTGQD